MAAAHVHRGCDHLIRRKALHKHADGGDIRHRIQGSHLMEMNLADGHSVGVAFCLGDQSVDRHDVLLYLLGDLEMPHNDVPDIMEAAVVVMAMFMAMLMIVFLFLMMFMRVPVMRLVMVFVVMAVGLFMMMGVKMGVKAFFFLSIYRNPHMGAGDAAFFHGLRLKADTGYPCGLKVPKEGLPVRQEFKKCSRQHIPGSPHSTVKI